MKKYLVSAMLLLSVLTYVGYFWTLPNVTVVNQSSLTLKKVIVKLPNSNLNFGQLPPAEANTIYYSLAQSDGVYRIFIDIEDTTLTAQCGYVTGNELNKRVVIRVDKNHAISCDLV